MTYEYQTKCDFGVNGREDIMGRHRTMKTALNQYGRIWEIYHKIHGWKVWLEAIKVKGK